MRQITELQEKIENDISHAKISEEAYDLWKSNDVTILFMSCMKEMYLEKLTQQPVGDQLAVFTEQIARKTVCELIDQFLEWNPLKQD